MIKRMLIATAIASMTLSAHSAPKAASVFGTENQISDSKTANALFRDGDILYFGDKGHVYLYDLSSNRVNPRLISTIELPGLVRQLTVKDGILYTANRETGVYIFNVSNPAAPALIKRFDTVEFATGIDIAGDVLFVSERQNGVEFIDVSDPSKAAHIDILKTNESQSCFYHNGYLYSGEWGKGMVTVFDASNMDSIREIKTVNLQGYGDGVYASGNLLFASTGHQHLNGTPSTEKGDGHGLEIFDITDPADPKFISRVEFGKFFASGNDYWTCRPSGDGKTVFCADTGNGVYAVDITTKTKPAVLGNYSSPSKKPVSSIAIGDGYVYVSAYGDGLYAVKSSKAVKFDRNPGAVPSNVGARKAYATPANSAFNVWVPEIRSQVHSAAAYGDALFVACGDGGLAVVKQKPDGTLYKFAEGPSKFAGDVKVKDGKLYVAEGTDGMAVYNIGSDMSLSQNIRVDNLGRGSAYNIALWMYTPNNNYVVVGSRFGGYIFMTKGGSSDAPTFKTKMMKNSYNAYNKFTPDTVCYGDAFPLITKYGITWFDLGKAGVVPAYADPSETDCKTSLSEGISNYKDGKAIYVHNGCLRIVESNGKVDESVSDKSGKIFGIPRWDGGNRILMSGTLAKRVSVVNVSGFPAVASEVYEKTTGQPEAGIFWKGKAVVPCGYQGLLVEK